MVARFTVNFIDKNPFSGSHNNDDAFELMGVARWSDFY